MFVKNRSAEGRFGVSGKGRVSVWSNKQSKCETWLAIVASRNRGMISQALWRLRLLPVEEIDSRMLVDCNEAAESPHVRFPPFSEKAAATNGIEYWRGVLDGAIVVTRRNREGDHEKAGLGY